MGKANQMGKEWLWDVTCSQNIEDAPLKPSALIKSIKSSILYFNSVFQKQGKSLRLFIPLFLTNHWEDIDKGWFLYLSARENVSMEAGAVHSATFFEKQKGDLWQPSCKYCSFLRHFVWFDVVMQWGTICYVQLHESLDWSFYSLRSSFIQ